MLYTWLNANLRETQDIVINCLIDYLVNERYIGIVNDFRTDNPYSLGGREQEELLSVALREHNRLKQLKRELTTARAERRTVPSLGDGSRQITGQEMVFDEVTVNAMLTETERKCASQVTSYLSALLSVDLEVLSFRNDLLPDGLINLQQAEQFIASPAARLLTASRFMEYGLTAQSCGSDIKSWYIGHTDTKRLMRYQMKSHFIVDWAETSKSNCQYYRAMIDMVGRRIHSGLLGSYESLLWIPFVPENMSAYRGDESFPRMFPTSVADRLGHIGEQLAQSYPWDASEIWPTVHLPTN